MQIQHWYLCIHALHPFCCAGLVKDGQVPGAIVTYLSAALGTALGAVTGTTPLIIAAESAVGIKEGGRTGLVAVMVSGCFLCAMFLAPLLQVGLVSHTCVQTDFML
jgi:xanthine/uracil/vitamin C permease (AzgA family)